MAKEDTKAMVDAWVASGKRVKVVAPGKRVTTDREIALAARGLRPKAGSIECILMRHLKPEEWKKAQRAVEAARAKEPAKPAGGGR